ncbi:hypothetical protein K470DRAFT_267235 [Piedraia hortae CBS 480.64]|uniref:SH3 domain-containing protein n=1 Tax=Piedraia hortae CBS 480.64 TaxID=1314780 RepID=A0A6A7CBF5_9PEZI|nr:hypothetical protein K470DRAFT_267235 [Piedraia hortae CBS 480.64]
MVSFKVKAVYDYSSEHADDLQFTEGQVITVTQEEGDDWYTGTYTDGTGTRHEGLFPKNFVERFEPEIPVRPARPARTQEARPQAAEAAALSSPSVPPPAEQPAPPLVQPEQPPVATSQSEKPVTSPLTERPPEKVAAAPAAEQPPADVRGETAPKSPPPVAPKSSAFKDRIAAFNKAQQAPIAPVQFNKPQRNDYIKKPFVADPPKHSYVPPVQKSEPIQKPVVHDQKPTLAEGQKREPSPTQTEEDQEAPKPLSLKERMAMLQREQEAQRSRHADMAKKAVPKTPAKKPSDVAEAEQRSERVSQDRPRIPDAPPASSQDILSEAEETGHPAAGETGGEAAVSESADDHHREQDARENDVEEEEEMDEEELRKQRLRERMARLAGGQQGGGPFNPFGMPPVRKPSAPERKVSDSQESRPVMAQPIAIPGMGPAMPRVQSPLAEDKQLENSQEHVSRPPEDTILPSPKARPVPPPPPSGERPAPPSAAGDISVPPPPPSDRPAPPPPPRDRAVPAIPGHHDSSPTDRSAPPVPAESHPVAPSSPGPGSESDDEMSLKAKRSSAEMEPLPPRPGIPPPLPVHQEISQSTPIKRSSYLSSEADTPSELPSRAPPIPGHILPQREATHSSLQESEYEGDYDTDIASKAKHKDALEAHTHESSLDGSAPEVPRAAAPPPPQHMQPPRMSLDVPGAPPPAPPTIPQQTRAAPDTDEYDPFRYTGRPSLPVSHASPVVEHDVESDADEDEPQTAAPLPPRSARQSLEAAHPRQSMEVPHRLSTDVQRPRQSTDLQPPRHSQDVPRHIGRRSVDLGRTEEPIMARDIDLVPHTQWWTLPRPLPPALQARDDILWETEETQQSKRGGRTSTSKDVYVLYLDYSQTIFTAHFDPRDPYDARLEQRHEPPPAPLRPDQLQAYWGRFGKAIGEAANAAGHNKKDNILGDGTAASLPLALIQAQAGALLPVGTKAYGALVYANLANASTLQYDEIRPGDIVTLRQARFEGHSGAMKTKYKADYGPSHVGVVEEWDGSRRSLRCWEQGRERKAGVRSEKLRLGDLRNGEVRIWRVVGRQWVGWEIRALKVGQNSYALRLDKTLWHIFSDQGELYCKMGQWVEAESVLEEKLRGIGNMRDIEANLLCAIRMFDPDLAEEEPSGGPLLER